MRKTILSAAAAVAVTMLFAAPLAAQTAAKAPSDPAQVQAEIDKAIEAMRKDARAAKSDILGKTMKLDSAQAAAFWPVYKQFEGESAKLGDERVAIVKDYATAWNSKSLTDATAKDLLTRSMAVEDKARALDKKTIDEMSKVLPAKTVARYFQVQNRLNALARLSLASEIPLIY